MTSKELVDYIKHLLERETTMTTKYNWCSKLFMFSSRPALNPVIKGSDLEKIYTRPSVQSKDAGCGNWVCSCGHRLYLHKVGSGCNKCSCILFIYLNNDNCTIECQFQRKVYEQEDV